MPSVPSCQIYNSKHCSYFVKHCRAYYSGKCEDVLGAWLNEVLETFVLLVKYT